MFKRITPVFVVVVLTILQSGCHGNEVEQYSASFMKSCIQSTKDKQELSLPDSLISQVCECSLDKILNEYDVNELGNLDDVQSTEHKNVEILVAPCIDEFVRKRSEYILNQ